MGTHCMGVYNQVYVYNNIDEKNIPPCPRNKIEPIVLFLSIIITYRLLHLVSFDTIHKCYITSGEFVNVNLGLRAKLVECYVWYAYTHSTKFPSNLTF